MSIITEKDILDAINKLKPMPPITMPYVFAGLKIYQEPTLPPKLTLSKSVDVSEEFRKDMNLWLLDMFGFRESLLPKDKVFIFQDFGMAIMKPEQIATLNIS